MVAASCGYAPPYTYELIVCRLLSASTVTLTFTVAELFAESSWAEPELLVADWDLRSGSPAREALTTNRTRHSAAKDRAKGYIGEDLRGSSLCAKHDRKRTEVH